MGGGETCLTGFFSCFISLRGGGEKGGGDEELELLEELSDT